MWGDIFTQLTTKQQGNNTETHSISVLFVFFSLYYCRLPSFSTLCALLPQFLLPHILFTRFFDLTTDTAKVFVSSFHPIFISMSCLLKIVTYINFIWERSIFPVPGFTIIWHLKHLMSISANIQLTADRQKPFRIMGIALKLTIVWMLTKQSHTHTHTNKTRTKQGKLYVFR